jgi:hypothetical protein
MARGTRFIRRLERDSPAVARDLNGGSTAVGQSFPDLEAPAAFRGEVHPLAVTRPEKDGVIRQPVSRESWIRISLITMDRGPIWVAIGSAHFLARSQIPEASS